MEALRKKLLFTGIFAGNGRRKSRKEGREVHMLKVLGAQVKEFKKASILTPIFMILEVIMETVIPLLMRAICSIFIQLAPGWLRRQLLVCLQV